MNTLLRFYLKQVAEKIGLESEIISSSFHAGAETHIYANKLNAKR